MLEFMGKEYLPNDYVDIAGNLSGAYLSAAKLLGAEKSLDLKEGKPVRHCFDPENPNDAHFKSSFFRYQ